MNMQRLYRLTDDIDIPSRWHLDGIERDGSWENNFLEARKLPSESRYRTRVLSGKRRLEFCLTSFGEPVCCKSLAEKIMSIAGGDEVQLLPLSIDQFKSSYVALNVIRTYSCIDEKRSEYTKWSDSDGRPDRLGDYRDFSRMLVAPRLVPDSAAIFRVTGWQVALIVTEKLKVEMEFAGCFGAKFDLVSN